SVDAMWVVTTWFGTPDEPRIPNFIQEDEKRSKLLSLERLQQASGPAEAEGRGLYRKHCVLCHGVTGNGRGPNAAVQNPYPRDYRMGIFKFKTTPAGSKPTRDDLARVIRNGISGTAMTKIKELTEDDVQALVDYVIYLSWRGQLERALLTDGAENLDFEAGQRIADGEYAEQLEKNPDRQKVLADLVEAKDPDAEELVGYETYKAFDKRLKDDSGLKERLEKLAADSESGEVELTEEQEKELEQLATYNDFVEELASDEELAAQLEEILEITNGEELSNYISYQETMGNDGYNVEYANNIADAWLAAAGEVIEVPEPPAGLPLPQTHKEYVSMSQGDQAAELAASVKRGQELFVGKIASCSKCHGEKGLGNGQTNDYDAWTKDWTVNVNLKPDDREALIPLLARGALSPVNAIPRNFQEGIFRGGSTSADLYRRITQGIDGSPMPAAGFVTGQFEQEDVWHIINFIRSLQQADAPPASASESDPPAPAA
ncbi:MAG: c-type cytochrome, partial [Pirellulales bacterium]|nr:c-type cytochrome [Pirellulales bacterium]